MLITHIHTDHSGGLTRGGQMLFPNATIHVGQAYVDCFMDRASLETGLKPLGGCSRPAVRTIRDCRE